MWLLYALFRADKRGYYVRVWATCELKKQMPLVLPMIENFKVFKVTIQNM
jgi:hypothetical protein